jgi:hypothetical protein
MQAFFSLEAFRFMNNYLHLFTAKVPVKSRVSKLAIFFVILALVISPFSFRQGLVGASVAGVTTSPRPVTPPDSTHTPRPTPVTPPDPTGTPSPRPTPVTPPDPNPTNTPRPSSSPVPTATPPVTQPDPVNSDPIILTTSLTSGNVGQVYYATVYALDTDNDELFMNFYNLPNGLYVYGCKKSSLLGYSYIKCVVRGVPQNAGIYDVIVLVYDEVGNNALKSFQIDVVN